MRKILFIALCTAWAFTSHAQQKVGINTTNPKANFHVSGTNSSFLVGDSLHGAGTRMMWLGNMAAFRGGQLSTGSNASNWNLDSIGFGSFGFGVNTKATGLYSIAMGGNTKVRGPQNIGLGTDIAIKGSLGNVGLGASLNMDGSFGAMCFGHSDTIIGGYGLSAIGYRNKSVGSYGIIAVGSNNKADGLYGTMAIGENNNINGNSGSMAIGTNNVCAGSQGSITLGFQNVANGGNGMVVIGKSNIVSGSATIAIGANHTNTGYNGATTLGIACTNVGHDGAMAMGSICNVTGSYGATALGHNCTVTGSNGAMALGYSNAARAHQSYCGGSYLVAHAFGETVVGSLNDTLDYFSLPSSVSYELTDRIFTVGNGTLTPGGQFRRNAIVILKNGNMGIGENKPTNLLQLKAVSGFTGSMQLNIDENSTGFGRIGFSNTGTLGWTLAAHRDNTASSSSMNFYSNQLNADVLSLRGDGSACFYGNVKANVVATCSDVRYKSNVKTIKDALKKVQAIDGVTYTYKVNEYADQHFPTQEQAGLIAQQVESVLPQVVYTDANGYKSVDYAKVVPLLVEAIKELKKELGDVKKSNDLLLSSIEARLNVLEGRGQ